VKTAGRIPVLGGARLVANGSLSIYGTNLFTGIAAIAECDVKEPGQTVIDAGKLSEVAGKLRGNVSIRTSFGPPASVKINCGRSRFALVTLPVGDFPVPLVVDSDMTAIDLSAADVAAVFSGAANASADDEKKIYLAGPALFSEPVADGYRLCGVGTDSVCLSYAATSAGCPDLGSGVLIHRDTCKLAVNLFGKTGAAVRWNSNIVEFASTDRRLTAKLIEASPAAWRTMVQPTDEANAAVLARAELVAALERCAAVYDHLTADVGKKAPLVRIQWDAESDPDVTVSFRQLTAPPAALDVITPVSVTGAVNKEIDPSRLLKLLEGVRSETVLLSAGAHYRDPLRVDAGGDRFVVLAPRTENVPDEVRDEVRAEAA
jgi:DNA polymerase III sliding clamp (beta) subunit (PCNA family)